MRIPVQERRVPDQMMDKKNSKSPISQDPKTNTPSELPERPIPELSKTIKGLNKSAAPFLNSFQKIRHHLFTAASGAVLSPLQARLKEDPKGWANRAMQHYYLTNRKSLAFYSNVFYLMENDPNCTVGLDRAAAIIRASLEFYRSLKNGSLAPDVFKGTSWGTEPYHPLFSTSRLPQKDRDQLSSWQSKRHIVIAYSGSLYQVDFFLTDGIEEISHYSQIHKTLKNITQGPAGELKSQGVGAFTTLPRQPWADIRKDLLQNPTNQRTIETIESAILFVALDFDSFPQDRTESIWMLAHNHPENRWYDKSHQLIISGNGKAGINRDHTAVDGNPTSRYISEVCQRAQIILKEFKEDTRQNGQKAHLFKKLQWELKAPHLALLNEAFKKSDLECQKRELLVFDYLEIGEEFFRLHQLSSDTAIQIVIQLAAYKCMGKLMSVNEAVNMRHFKNGRYDTIFCVSKESKRFVTYAALPQANIQELRRKFKQAVQAHRALVKDCKVGNSPYLHLSALMGLQTEQSLFKIVGTGIEIFTSLKWKDFGFSKILNSDVTTSNPGIKAGMEILGFTDTVPNVMGVAYLVDSNCVRLFIKTDHLYFGKANELKTQLIAGLGLLKEILGTKLIE